MTSAAGMQLELEGRGEEAAGEGTIADPELLMEVMELRQDVQDTCEPAALQRLAAANREKEARCIQVGPPPFPPAGGLPAAPCFRWMSGRRWYLGGESRDKGVQEPPTLPLLALPRGSLALHRPHCLNAFSRFWTRAWGLPFSRGRECNEAESIC